MSGAVAPQLNRPLPYQPLQFGPSASPRFGWFHPPIGPSRATGVVICNPIGDDTVRAHRALRHLAERLAQTGFAVLRFDFHGTGDSSGAESDPDRVAAWKADIGLAIAELRARSAAAEIAVVGLRLGGTIAMVATAEAPVQSLVLWGAYPRGEAYVTETTKLHQMHRMLEPQSFAVEPSGWNAGGEQALGFLLTPETIADLAKIDLLTVDKSPASRTLVIGTGNVAGEQPLLAQLRGLGGEADHRHLPGHKFLVQINHRSDVPTPVIDAIVGWLGERHPVSTEAAATPAARPAVTSAERPIVFGDQHALFGILVEPPVGQRDPKRPVIIMTNAGCVHRIGPHRFYVPMARRWAALGFSVLRMDLSGIGDSPVADGCQENLTYPRDGLDDLGQAMTALERLTGAKKFIVLGLCSGGDLAFQIGFQDRRVAGSVMMNPRTFCVHDLQMVDTYKRARYYQDSLFRLSSWKKALRGEVDFKRAVRMVLPKFENLVKERLGRFLPGGNQDAKTDVLGANGVKHNDVPARLRSMAERGVDTFLVASEKDPGVDYVDVHFGRQMQALNGVRGFRREDFLGTDHTFTSIFAQQKVSEILTRHFAEHHLS